MNTIECVQNLYPALIAGNVGSVLPCFGMKATIDTPSGGKQLPPEWVSEERSWLAVHSAEAKSVSTIATETRVAHEIALTLQIDGKTVELPVLLIADIAENSLRDLRIYHSTWPLSGRHMVRAPLLEPNANAELTEPVASYEKALAAGNIDALQALFEEDGYVREPSGEAHKHVGEAREKFYGPLRKTGGVPLKTATVTDDGYLTVIEYICDEWGGTRLPAQAGAAVWERSAAGAIAGVRIYDDVMPPEGLFD